MNPGLGIWFKAEIIYNQKLFEYFRLKKKKFCLFFLLSSLSSHSSASPSSESDITEKGEANSASQLWSVVVFFFLVNHNRPIIWTKHSRRVNLSLQLISLSLCLQILPPGLRLHITLSENHQVRLRTGADQFQILIIHL